MGHDWWSVGVILFELLVGMPPFNAEHPQDLFDNIMNRKIPGHVQIPDEMSYDARDLIDKLLNESPVQRIGATGSKEVKRHTFFKDINWDTLARQKAALCEIGYRQQLLCQDKAALHNCIVNMDLRKPPLTVLKNVEESSSNRDRGRDRDVVTCSNGEQNRGIGCWQWKIPPAVRC